MIDKKILSILLLTAGISIVFSTTNLFSIIARIIVKGYPVLIYEISPIVDKLIVPTVYNESIMIAKPRIEKLSNGFLIDNVEFNGNLSALVLAFHTNRSVFDINVSIIPDSYELGASPLIILATANLEYYKSPWTASRLISEIYNKNVTLQYLGDSLKDFYVIDYKFCRKYDSDCELSLEVRDNYTEWYNIIIVSDGSGSLEKWTMKVYIS